MLFSFGSSCAFQAPGASLSEREWDKSCRSPHPEHMLQMNNSSMPVRDLTLCLIIASLSGYTDKAKPVHDENSAGNALL